MYCGFLDFDDFDDDFDMDYSSIDIDFFIPVLIWFYTDDDIFMHGSMILGVL